MKRALKTGCLALLIALLCAAVYGLNAFFGNPVSSYLAERSIRAYLAEHYAHSDLQTDWFGYTFKTSDYYMVVSVPGSRDIHFTVYARPGGTVRYDTYDSVTGGWNTWDRLESEYRGMTNALFDAEDFELRNDIAFGTLKINEEAVGDYQPIAYGVELDKLVIDGEYDVSALAKDAGQIVFYMQHEDVTFETAARGMLRLKELLEENGIPFFAMDFVLRLPREEGQPGSGGPVINVREFPCSEIYEEGMAQRVQAAHEQLEAYYAEQDKLK
ncbi:MAG: hypothetical protein IKU34_00955 [Clostridia bacterium]|nr:hypothetical protein [Clostridia bacterium]